MVQCFVPDCLHQSESHTCKYFRFPDEVKDKKQRQVDRAYKVIIFRKFGACLKFEILNNVVYSISIQLFSKYP